MALIQVENLSFQYLLGNGKALDGVSLTVEEGELCAVIGPNGSGKSSLCYAIRGFIPHFFRGQLTGDVIIDGKRNSERTLGEIGLDVGFVFQNPFTQLSGVALTVEEEIGFGLENLGVPREEIRRRVDEMLELLDIAALRDRSPYELSGGQQQKVAIASILVMQPHILILDEPTSQLDPIGTEQVFEVIDLMKRRGITVILVEHKLELISRFADKVVVLRDGRVLLSGGLREVFAHPDFERSGLKPPVYVEVSEAARRRFGVDVPVALTHEECVAVLRSVDRRGGC
ncbi:MAG: ABC transporter ATP-binding protein [Limnochordales bacterium]|jgi:ABC-type cobalt transport system, ATPase component|nr:ABC transporter ATP-binding protein [Bacillota bacterium]